MSTPSTLVEAFFARTTADADRVALRRKHLGLWEELTFAEYAERVEAVSRALVELGVAPGTPVGLIAENRPEWLFTDLGIIAAGAVTCAIYTTSSPEQIGYILSHCGAKVVVVENEEQLDKLLVVRESHPIDHIVVMDEKGLATFSDPGVRSFDAVLELGRNSDVDLAERRAAIRGDDLAILVYTSGTTGPPKGVMLSHTNIIWACHALKTAAGAFADDEFLSFLPLCHIAERIVTVFHQIVNGSVVSFAEALDTVADNLAEVRPSFLFAVPRIWEKMMNGVELRMREATWFKQRMYAWALEVGREANVCRREGRAPPSAYAAADRLVLLPLRDKLGLDRVRMAATGAAPISPEVVDYFQAIGVPLVEVYGQTESSAVITLNSPGFRAPGKVGEPAEGLELRLAEDGEILAKGPGVMLGYFDEAEATARTVQDGWLHTGDVGELDDEGQLHITDRKKDLIITAGGKNVAPQYIESKLRTSAYVHDAIVIGDGRKFLTALIVLDEDNLIAWAQRERVQFGAYAELAKSPDVLRLIDEEVSAVNKTLTHVEALKRFTILERRLDTDEGELTPTLKVRRKVIAEKYADAIEAMYR
ncbi:MAG: long-chain fatty acid--CoA ligase [Deltaproteobacteria bacterium]